MILLNDILKEVDIISVSGDSNVAIAGIEFDSRRVTEDSLFIAVRGSVTDGHRFIEEAVASGASAVICEILPCDAGNHICWIKVKDSAKALGIVASRFYRNPSASVNLIGVTGTNGKTTVATLLYRLFKRLGFRCGLISTVSVFIEDEEFPVTHTTPDPVQINRLLAEMVDRGCEYAFMEVSSHAVEQQRIAGLMYKGGIFTNLTHDHLDYHKTFDSYLAAKKRFFDSLPEDSFAIVNLDDRNAHVMVQNCKARQYTFSVRGMADYRCKIVEQDFNGMVLKIEGREVSTRFIGDFNASNLLAVYAAAALLGENRDTILTIISDLSPVRGRLELIRSGEGVTGIVDYAHTPDALLNVLNTINRIKKGDEKIITVVGAGGDRDRTKRPKMAAISAEKSTLLILTSDNPRSENPEMILDDMEAGLTDDQRDKTIRIADRREAIKTAVRLAKTGDVILIAGKGHETYQERMGVRHPFDDREELRNAFSIN